MGDAAHRASPSGRGDLPYDGCACGGGGGAPPMRAGNAGLMFDADFEAGNIGSVRSVSDFEYEISLRPDTNAPRYRLWYYFRVRFDPCRNVFGDRAAPAHAHRVVFRCVLGPSRGAARARGARRSGRRGRAGARLTPPTAARARARARPLPRRVRVSRRGANAASSTSRRAGRCTATA